MVVLKPVEIQPAALAEAEWTGRQLPTTGEASRRGLDVRGLALAEGPLPEDVVHAVRGAWWKTGRDWPGLV